MDILIRAKKEKVEHKFKENVIADNPEENPEELYCYWTGINPKQKNLGKVMFTDGNTVYGEAKILGVTDWNGLEFKPLKRVDYLQPKKAPTRGFTYVN